MHLTVVNATYPKSPRWSTADVMILGSLAAVHHLTDTKVVSCSPVDHAASSGRTRRIASPEMLLMMSLLPSSDLLPWRGSGRRSPAEPDEH
jgi:hypothetical protein